MFKTIGICGTGNMGKAMLKGIIGAGLIAPENVFIYDSYTAGAEALKAELGVTLVSSATELVKKAEAVIFALKPYVIGNVLNEIKGDVGQTIVISIAAGVTIERLAKNLEAGTKIIRVMPNTPALVGEGMAALAPNSQVTDEEAQAANAVFNSFGKAELVDEGMIDVICGLSGSGPAFVYLFIEALADGAVLEGMPRAMAYKFAAQTVLGAAKMVLETGEHPGLLKDNVSSPGGTTIEGVSVLEEKGFRSAAIDAVVAATEKSKSM